MSEPVHDAAGAVEEQQEVDAELHESNRSLRKIKDAAARVVRTRGDEHVRAFKELKERVEEYEALVGEGS